MQKEEGRRKKHGGPQMTRMGAVWSAPNCRFRSRRFVRLDTQSREIVVLGLGQIQGNDFFMRNSAQHEFATPVNREVFKPAFRRVIRRCKDFRPMAAQY